jgi:hypothetical protein
VRFDASGIYPLLRTTPYSAPSSHSRMMKPIATSESRAGLSRSGVDKIMDAINGRLG